MDKRQSKNERRNDNKLQKKHTQTVRDSERNAINKTKVNLSRIYTPFNIYMLRNDKMEREKEKKL